MLPLASVMRQHFGEFVKRSSQLVKKLTWLGRRSGG